MNRYMAYIKWHLDVKYENGEFVEYENIINFEAENAEKAKDYILEKNWIIPSNNEVVTILHYYLQHK
ncbi:hypothetical protein [Paenibacillus xylanexedens]|uniref:hypothetical protein n=1 Tax=Paenibacillus xylanexedens TaxID=528191 RepID=UPI0011A577CC|nr:hypothetical protein [Paenibacillus xylanexedens]